MQRHHRQQRLPEEQMSFAPNVAFWTTVVAVLGTTISPYLFFWQAAQEVEDIRAVGERKPLVKKPQQAPDAMQRIRLDTYVAMDAHV